MFKWSWQIFLVYNYIQLLFTCYARSNLTKVIQKKIGLIWFNISFPTYFSLEKPFDISNLRYGICDINILKKGKGNCQPCQESQLHVCNGFPYVYHSKLWGELQKGKWLMKAGHEAVWPPGNWQISMVFPNQGLI